jgi:hypothetical protein
MMKLNYQITVAEECTHCGYSHTYTCKKSQAPPEGGIAGDCPACFMGMLQIVYRE